MVTGASDINTDHGYSRITDADMALSCSTGPVITMAFGSSTGCSDVWGPNCNMDSGGRPNPRHSHNPVIVP